MRYVERFDEVLAEIVRGRERAARVCGQAAVEYAQEVCPVDTGRLRASIAFAVQDGTAAVGTDVPYAAYVELGTARQAAQPYLVPALVQHADEYADLIRAAMQKEDTE